MWPYFRLASKTSKSFVCVVASIWGPWPRTQTHFYRLAMDITHSPIGGEEWWKNIHKCIWRLSRRSVRVQLHESIAADSVIAFQWEWSRVLEKSKFHKKIVNVGSLCTIPCFTRWITFKTILRINWRSVWVLTCVADSNLHMSDLAAAVPLPGSLILNIFCAENSQSTRSAILGGWHRHTTKCKSGLRQYASCPGHHMTRACSLKFTQICCWFCLFSSHSYWS